jgi:hypothetical protein
MTYSWRKSSYSGDGGSNCVEVADHDNRVLVRDTKQNDAGPVLRFAPEAWRRFAQQVKRSLASDLTDVFRGSLVSGEAASRLLCEPAAFISFTYRIYLPSEWS